MSIKKLTKKVEELHLKGEHEEIIKLIEGEKEVNANLISILARAYQNLDEPDFMKAYELLSSCEEELHDDINFNFRMAYNLYYRDILASAKSYFEKVLEIQSEGPLRDDTLEFIKDCNHRIELGVTDFTLNERIESFWNDFKDADELYELTKSDEHEDAIKVLDMIQYLLKKNSLSAAIEVGMGSKFDKPHIIFSPEGMFINLIIYKQILSLIPKEVEEKYDFSIGRNRGRNFGFRMNGVDLDGDNVELAYTESDGKLKIYLKNEELLSLYEQDPNSVLNMAYIFTDSFFGELFCMRHISNVIVADNKELSYKLINEVVDEILSKFEDESYADYPYDTYSSYSFGEVEKIEKVRDDIIGGMTCLVPIIGDYLSCDTYSFDTSFDSGLVYTSLIFDIGDLEPKEALSIRHEIEDLLEQKQEDVFKIVGGAFGVYSMYIDIAVFDMKRFKSEIIDYYISVARDRGIKNAYFGVIRCGEQVFTLFDDSEEE